MRSGLLTLTTDFGPDGPYVAAMKGVVLGLAPGTRLVDVSHAIAPQDVAGGAFVLAQVVDWFPPGTVHLAVVDPGVGTDRRLVVVEARGQRLVLPDNGLFGGVIEEPGPWRAWEILDPRWRRADASATFHGRDILAPVAAHLLNGGDPADVGPPVVDLLRLPTPAPAFVGRDLVGEVVFVDPFGNLITNIARPDLGDEGPGAWTVEVLGRSIPGLVRAYGERPAGSLVALVGSGDRVEVAVVNGDAARWLGAARGARVVLRLAGGDRP